MDRDTLFTVSLALCCVVALGAASTALESSVSTEPGELIDLDYETLPISSGDAAELREQYEEGPDGSSGDPGGSGGGAEPTETLLDQLLAVLAVLFDLVLRALPALVALAALVVAVRRRHAIAGRFRTGGDETPAEAGALIDGEPNDAVARAWYEMVRRLDLEERREKTPREFESEAIDRGADPEAVADLTRTFEDVRYGEHAPTDDRSRRVRSALARVLGGDTDRDGGSDEPRDSKRRPTGDRAVRSDGGDRR